MKTSEPTKSDFKTISKIADRAHKMACEHQPDFKRTKVDIMMDIECCHETMPLDLGKLLAADDFNFAHDVFGIARHLNRQTRKMEDCFVPRSTLPVS